MIDPAPGVLLIADPFLKDPNFLRTVVLLTEHNDKGSVGFVINRLYENTLDELIPDFEGHKIPVYYGGPVQLDSIHFIHQYPDEIQGGQEIAAGVFWGGDFEAAIELIRTNAIDINKLRFFIGYSGWEEEQLAGELAERTWLTVAATRKIIFQTDAGQIWKDAIKQLGGEYEMMVNFPIDPQLN